MAYLKRKIINLLLQLNLAIGDKLVYWMALYEVDDYAEKNEKFDLRTIPERIKNLMIHDDDIIQERMSICRDCEHFIKTTSQCNKCKCFMKWKTKIAPMGCPVGKWGKIDISNATHAIR